MLTHLANMEEACVSGCKPKRRLFQRESSSESDDFVDDSDADPNYLPMDSSGSESNVSVV